jgi:putative membrane protein
MAKVWLDTAAERALLAAVTQIESTSAAEVAIAVRRAARSWPHVPAIVGGVAGWATLAFMLFSEPFFALGAFLIDPLLVGAIAAAVTTLWSAPIRWFTSESTRRAEVARAARATFVERGVHRTRARTGVLVYCALAERVAVIVADAGVESALSPGALAEWEASIDQAMARGGVATASAVAAMASAFAAALPRASDDVNELQDAIGHDVDRRPRG